MSQSDLWPCWFRLTWTWLHFFFFPAVNINKLQVYSVFFFFSCFPNTPNQLYLVGDPFCKSHPHPHLRHMGMCIILYICSLYFLYFVRTYKLDLLSVFYRIKINVIYTYNKFAKQHLKNISHTSSQTSASTPICISGELKFVNSRSK